ncbi:MAG TPA: sigma-70 family RNA polymerase sigma factor [Bacteroidales bacterium]|nr:sigma-70 family RNA polymerase sigma factor [Bacteroidales bacterium]HOS72126.1 sigma-70 family RNA polymerase sigma factor [Bacteroidales bacterium]HQH24199.1 sigma-70 family RNA polymerase sigma factor [Bacteroidales bacterium]HQJ81823.1 sigma-70 family RNA polymerase sigma factor [Bacteroidales bacterium]
MPEIRNIINGCLKGSRRDQELLYRRYAPSLYAVCLQYSDNDEEARDILQEGFIKIFTNLSHFKYEGSFEGWMRRIIVNTALEKYRSRNRLYMVEDIDMIPEPFVDPDNEDYSGLDAGDLMEIIRMLPPKYRMVFNLFALEGYSHREISRMINISEGTSKSNLARARMILQRRVEAYTGIKKKVLNG